MKMSFMSSTWESSMKANVALSISNVVLAAIAAIAVNHSYSIKQEIVITPPVIDEKLVIGWDSANADYFKSFGMYAVSLIANVTPTNAKFVADSISMFVHSSIYPEIRKTILSTAESRRFKEVAGSTKFEANSIQFEASSHKVFVLGTTTFLTAINPQPPRAVVYELTMRIENRQPVIYGLESYEGNQPRTEQWRIDHKAELEAAAKGAEANEK